ncbi:mitochondrial Rho GTPase 2-like protein [Tanacetum coccineum]
MSIGTVAGAPIPCRRRNVRVVVVGDRSTGKSSLIAAAASKKFPKSVASVLPPTHLPALPPTHLSALPPTHLSADYYPDGVSITIIDTALRFILFTYLFV